MWRSLVVVVATILPVSTASADEIQLLGVGKLPGHSSDHSGLKDLLSDGTPHNRLGGLGSAITYIGKVMLSVCRRLLIVTADNDFVATAPFRVYTNAVPASRLPGDVPQQLPRSSY